MIPFHAGPRFIERYWCERIPADERDRIVAAIPEGHGLRLTAGRPGQPGTATVRLITDGRLVAEARGQLTASLVWSVLPRQVVTTDAGGNVTSWEEAV